MTRREREDLERLSRDRERVAKSQAAARASELKAEFEQQIAAQYSFDQDPVWKEADREAKEAVQQARFTIAARCQQLGIPPQFAPDLSLSWYSRGENASKERRAELRKVAYTRLDALEKDAKTKIGLASSTFRMELLAGSLESDEAKATLQAMPTVENLMPTFSIKQIEKEVKPPYWMLQ